MAAAHGELAFQVYVTLGMTVGESINYLSIPGLEWHVIRRCLGPNDQKSVCKVAYGADNRTRRLFTGTAQRIGKGAD